MNSYVRKKHGNNPIASMYGIFTYIYHTKNSARNVGKYTIVPWMVRELQRNKFQPKKWPRFSLQGGPLPVISGVISPINGLING